MVRALQGSQVPVPTSVGLCEDESVLGGPFAVFGFVVGRVIRSRADLDEFPEATARALTQNLMAVTAGLHHVDYAAAGLGRFARPDSYGERQVWPWRNQWEIVATAGPRALGEEVGARLAAWMPCQTNTAIVHGRLPPR
jgi:aminoglycoside phosphotransferase (APT) family kinase protein